MPVDLSALARETRERIDVPPVPPAVLAAARSAAPNATGSGRPRIVAAALAGVSLIAVAAAATVAVRPHLFFSPTQGLTMAYDRTMNRARFRRQHPPLLRPSPAQVRAAARSMDFPVTLPAGVPGDRRPTFLSRFGTSALLLTYDLDDAKRGHRSLLIVLADPNGVASGTASDAPDDRVVLPKDKTGSGVRWRIGGEDVFLPRTVLSAAETERMHRAMVAAAAKGE